MALSMTGYGRAEEILHGREINVEIKSVNSRYFEYFFRTPRNTGFLDEPLKKALAAAMSRGKAELHLNMQNLEEGETQVVANIATAKGYRDAMESISQELGVKADVTASVLGRFSDVFTIRRSETDEEQLKADVMAVEAKAIEKFNAMRKEEGAKLVADISARLDSIEKMVDEVEKGSAERMQRYTDRLYQRLKEVLGDTSIEEGRILTEAAIFADKTAVDEETVRLRSHLAQFRQILKADGPVGRKLDFLTQEVNRETNTIGSKCQELEITRLVVDMKAEIEKIREQIQNLE